MMRNSPRGRRVRAMPTVQRGINLEWMVSLTILMREHKQKRGQCYQEELRVEPGQHNNNSTPYSARECDRDGR